MTIETIEPQWIYFTTSKFQADQLNATWNQKRMCYRLPNTLGTARDLWKITKDERILQMGKEKKAKHEQLMKLKALEDAPGDERLRPYQRVDVQYLSEIPHSGIFNEQRTGKTPTALKVLEAKGRALNYIVAPASILLQWEKEVHTWLPNATVYVNNESPKKRKELYENMKMQCTVSESKTSNKGFGKTHLTNKNDESLPKHSDQQQTFIIMSYGTIRSDLALLKRLSDCVADCSLTIDEAHRLGNRKSQQTSAIHSLSKKVQGRLALTGTPTQNSGDEIWGILHFLYSDRFPGYWQFVERYFHIDDGVYGKNIGGYKREQELLDIIRPISVQRKRADVMAWLPKKQHMTYTLDLKPKQRKAYQSVLETFEYYEDGELKVDASGVLPQLTRLRQICLDPSLLDIDAPSAKEEWLLEWLKDNPEEKVIIFSNFTSYLKRLHKKLQGSVVLHGELSASEKQRNVESFQKGTKGTNKILSNIEAGGQGWTIDQATTTIFLDRHFTNAKNEQAEDRMISTNPNHVTSNTVIDVTAKNTVDERILNILKDKKDVTEVINNYGLTGVLHYGKASYTV